MGHPLMRHWLLLIGFVLALLALIALRTCGEQEPRLTPAAPKVVLTPGEQE